MTHGLAKNTVFCAHSCYLHLLLSSSCMKMCATSHSVYVFRIASCQRQTHNKTVNKMFMSVEAFTFNHSGRRSSKQFPFYVFNVLL